MFLTPCECAQIMSEIENKEVSVRKVYYLLESFELLAVKIGNSCKITIQELEEYYERRIPGVQELLENLPAILSVKEVADVFNVSQITIRRLIYKRNLNAYKIPGEREWNINKSDLKKFIERNETINN
ncbi:helix-turn-helix domain-containing protein [Treponema phagedenis]|uniref:helix-turn-helix domain-containing protein n=1 Tax=Treponema phagedenis TaxID=162 RepID=UPI0015A57AB3|nr:helix-turn-helix domain-containing protein [Treponema phagedenis]NVP25334.1 helix-turn-helix domain-containing protein [Treponema phagedenis]